MADGSLRTEWRQILSAFSTDAQPHDQIGFARSCPARGAMLTFGPQMSAESPHQINALW
jgi:hypothetical protein